MSTINHSENKYDFDNSFGYLIAQAHWSLKNQLSRKFCDSNTQVTPDQWKVLATILNHDKLSQNDISKIQGKDRAGVKRLIDQLEIKKLIKRLPNPEDSRSYLVELTDSGKETCQRLNSIARNSLAEATKGFSESESLLFKRLLQQLIKNTSNI